MLNLVFIPHANNREMAILNLSGTLREGQVLSAMECAGRLSVLSAALIDALLHLPRAVESQIKMRSYTQRVTFDRLPDLRHQDEARELMEAVLAAPHGDEICFWSGAFDLEPGSTSFIIGRSLGVATPTCG